MKWFITLLAGALFGFGLSISTMIQPDIVLGFLRFQDMGLMLVMAGAAGVALLAYKGLPRVMRKPICSEHFHQHPSAWNRDTLWGSALFGVGWGLSGVCPGPAIASIGAGQWDVMWALLGIVLGGLAHGLRQR
ncbi:MAG: hypothetical protein RLZZ397_1260 [Pseudomonadota bacterium]|jgi:uncharacterized membrane protein YedE/YeeE